jgi:cell division protein FtsQ
MPRPEKTAVAMLAGLLQRHMRSVTGLILLAMLAATLLLGKYWLSDPYRFPLSVVEVEGDFRYLEKQQLQAAVAPHATGGFFTVDVGAIRAAAEQLPWVYKASVKRVWPATVSLQVDEQQPIARWGTQGFLNRFGEAFVPERTETALQLPALAGPDGQEQKVLERYQDVSESLASLGLQVTRLELDGRRSWHIQLDDSVALELGRAHAWQRLERFIKVYPEVFAGRMEELQRVDLRYSNGFSVYWQRVASTHDAESQG